LGRAVEAGIVTPLEWALAYEREGLSVVPAPLAGKRALVRWRQWQQMAADPTQLRIWWQRWPKANVAIICGRISNLVVVDVDTGHGGLGTLTAMEADHQLLDRSATVETPSGGRHYWLRHPGGRLSNSNKAIRDRYGPGVDIRGDGGLVLAPPSVRLVGAYRWRVGGPSTVPPMPTWLADLLRTRPPERRRVEASAEPTAGRLAGLERKVRTAQPSNRNNMLYWAAHRLREMDAPTSWAEALEQAAVDAGLPRDEAASTIASALGRVAS
jgi:Bifunctional DNA primase/polymerase, N-terminal